MTPTPGSAPTAEREPRKPPAGTPLIVIDMLNRYEHEDAEPLVEAVGEAMGAICGLIERAHREAVPVVYVNDNYDDWTAGGSELCRRALDGAHPELIEPLLPLRASAFLTKARHSVFYETQLEYALRRMEVRRVVLAGQVTEQCILYSALDAYVRHYEIVVPRDAVAHIHRDLADAALSMMETNMRARIINADALFAEASPSASRMLR
ncbi:MAG TPA: isochorismatase family cysteine hydrolase [Solirubrobacteraceae bacterium]|jgi:nicotinamidase-related amidase|nr:isochorismatase family cysteine hydrolase [Solirubrobacteraceae bacterium]